MAAVKRQAPPKTRQEALKMLANAPDDKVFWVRDGKVIRNLNELANALATMSEETFTYHCNAAKCDFTNWVRDVIGDLKLADDLVAVTRVQAMDRVSRRVSWWQDRAG